MKVFYQHEIHEIVSISAATAGHSMLRLASRTAGGSNFYARASECHGELVFEPEMVDDNGNEVETKVTFYVDGAVAFEAPWGTFLGFVIDEGHDRFVEWDDDAVDLSAADIIDSFISRHGS